MQVKLVARTLPVAPEYGTTPEEFIVYAARVSNPANQANHDTGARLLRYLVRKQHWSPLEMADAVIEIETTRDIARQILRHRSFSFQEFSQRYAEAPGFAAPRPARLQDPANRQNSIEEGVPPGVRRSWENYQNDLRRDAREAYEWALRMGIAKEVARAVLPEGLTVSRLYMKGSLRSWLHYVRLRCGPETQKEHREVAEACRDALAIEFPGLMGLLTE